MSAPQSPSISIRGLSEADVRVRQTTEGYNELPRPDQRTTLRIIFEVVREPMLALLLGGGAIYLLLGDLKEAIILLVFATMSVAITVIQESRTERVLEALSASWKHCATSPVRELSLFVTASANELPDGRWFAAISLYSAKATEYRPMPCLFKVTICRRMNRC